VKLDNKLLIIINYIIVTCIPGTHPCQLVLMSAGFFKQVDLLESV